ncbi:MAG: large conductance mechanosensitive channel protein MscL [Bdellovibrionaceae bacterium]|nr:large conductance mechanosensitive channel protein MscL [Pseudobdellovibrionaceae bacterium]
MGILKEFKEFAVRGNVIDMAVGIIIGTAFTGIVKSLVDGVIMPPLGLLLGGVDFSQLFINLSETEYSTLAEAAAAGAPVLQYGAFIQTVVDFTIVAIAVFMMVKAINSLKKKEEAAPAAPAATPEDIILLREIRDSLKK